MSELSPDDPIIAEAHLRLLRLYAPHLAVENPMATPATPKAEPTILVRNPASQVSRCGKCPARIIWATTEKGHAMPLNCAVAVTGGQIAGIIVEEKFERDDVTWYRVKTSNTHWATCSASKTFKKGKVSRHA
jgi:hypothetical protein